MSSSIMKRGVMKYLSSLADVGIRTVFFKAMSNARPLKIGLRCVCHEIGKQNFGELM